MKITKISIKLAMILPLLSLSLAANAYTLRAYDNLNDSSAMPSLSFEQNNDTIKFSKTRFAGLEKDLYSQDPEDDEYDDDEYYEGEDIEPPVGYRGR